MAHDLAPQRLGFGGARVARAAVGRRVLEHSDGDDGRGARGGSRHEHRADGRVRDASDCCGVPDGELYRAATDDA